METIDYKGRGLFFMPLKLKPNAPLIHRATVRNGSKAPNPTWHCFCAENEHTLEVPIPGVKR